LPSGDIAKARTSSVEAVSVARSCVLGSHGGR
jgi:hypothetical protein